MVADVVEAAGVLVAAPPNIFAGVAELLAGGAAMDGVELPPAFPKSPPVDGAELAAGFAPNKPPPPLAVLAPPKRPEVGAVVVCSVVVLGFDAAPPAKLPNAFAGLEESIGGAPAGVVDGRENVGFAGVAVVVVGVADWVLGAFSFLFPNSELPVLANRPEAGEADVAGVG